MLFSDLLISSEKQPTAPVVLPAIGSISFESNAARKYYPIGLRQKVCAINDGLMIAWAGSSFVAKSIVTGLRKSFQSSNATWSDLNSFFTEYGVYDLKDIQLIGLYVENEKLNSFGIKTQNFNHPNFGQCHIGGSGSGNLLRAIRATTTQATVEGVARDVDEAVNMALSFAIEFLVEELLAGPQDMQFGGAFEISALTQDGAEKVGDVLNLFWVYDPESDKNPRLLPTIIKQDYLGDDLVIQRLKLDTVGGVPSSIAEHIISVVSPPDRDPLDLRPKAPDLNPRYLCNCYYRLVGVDSIKRASTVFHSPKKTGPVQFKEIDDQLSLKFDFAHFEKEWGLITPALRK